MADPSIAVIGSVHPDRADELGLSNVDQAQKVARMIGGALARSCSRLVVYASEGWAVEPLVVGGYVEEYVKAAGSGAPAARIEIHYAQQDAPPRFVEQEKHEALFRYIPDSNPGWASSFYRSLGQVDGAVFLGGGQTAYTAGLVVLSHRKALLPVAAFGGAAGHVWKMLSAEPGVVERQEIEQMATPIWQPQTADTLIATLLEQHKRLQGLRTSDLAARRQSIAMRHAYVAVPFLILAFAAVPWTWDDPDWSRPFLLSLLLVAPLFAGISGATARTAFEAAGGGNSDAPLNLQRTIGLGAIAGGIAGALFVIAQLISMSPEIDLPIWSKQAGRLAPLAALIGFIGGLTLDAVFRRLTGMNVVSDQALKALIDRQPPG